jgi:hypothetical protein
MIDFPVVARKLENYQPVIRNFDMPVRARKMSRRTVLHAREARDARDAGTCRLNFWKTAGHSQTLIAAEAFSGYRRQ